MHNPSKLVKYGILVRMVYEVTSGYIGYMKIHTVEDKYLEEGILSLLESFLVLWHHVYQEGYYNSVEIAEKPLLRKTRVCGTIRANKGIPKSLADSFKS
jgi:hypothetical protein